MIDPSLTSNDRAFCIRARSLYRRSTDPGNQHEAAVAEDKLREHLAKRGCTLDDLPEILSHVDDNDEWVDPEPGLPPDPREALWKRNLLDLLPEIIGKYVGITNDEKLAVALWILHTHVYSRFTFTPRLALLSPVFGCGKTTLLELIGCLAHDPYPRFINVTAASLYRLMNAGKGRTILLDEGNNQNLLDDKTLRAVLNGNKRTDNLVRAGKGPDVNFYRAFSPLAIGARGKLPDDLLQRCVKIMMHRHPPDAPPLQPLNEEDIGFLLLTDTVRNMILKWRDDVDLDLDPENPVRNRYADNWRPLIAIADSLGHGDRVRELALRMTVGLPDDDARVLLLTAIRDIFDALRVDRIFSATLVDQLHNLEGEPWSEWIGLNNDRPPRPITQTQVAYILKDFGIAPKTIFPLGARASRGPSAKGYTREQFEGAWASYCRPGTPAHRHTQNLTVVKP
jgi:uncharacterized protein DUF3631